MVLVLVACVQNLTGTVVTAPAGDTAADTGAPPPGREDADTAQTDTGAPADTTPPTDTSWNGRDSGDTAHEDTGDSGGNR